LEAAEPFCLRWVAGSPEQDSLPLIGQTPDWREMEISFQETTKKARL